jgi:hypothetical protein
MAVQSFGMDREDIRSNKFKSYKGKLDQTDRIGVIFTDPKSIYQGAMIHYKDKYFVCKSTKTEKAICCTTSYEKNKPKWRIGAVIIRYDIQVRDGKPKLIGYELLPWIFGEGMYNTLKETNSEFSLESHDIKLKCKNEDFQNMEIIACNDSIWKKNPDLQKKVLAEYAAVLEDVKSNLGQDLSIEELKELLGVESQGSQDAATDVAMGDILESV